MNPRDYSVISFPGLGLEMDPSRTLSIGPLTIHYYGLIIAAGLLLAVIYGLRRCKQFGIKDDDIVDGVLWVTPFAILCARAYYCIFSWHEFAHDPISVLYIWNGGLAIYGGVIGAIIGVTVFCHFKKIKLAALLDLVLLGFLIGQGIGRWGNFFNREAFGAATDSFLRMGLYNMRTFTFEYYHPTFLYESLWNLTGFVLLHFSLLCTSCPRSGSMTVRSPWAMPLGTAWAEPLLKACGWTVSTGDPSGSASFWRPSAALLRLVFWFGRASASMTPQNFL